MSRGQLTGVARLDLWVTESLLPLAGRVRGVCPSKTVTNGREKTTLSQCRRVNEFFSYFARVAGPKTTEEHREKLRVFYAAGLVNSSYFPGDSPGTGNVFCARLFKCEFRNSHRYARAPTHRRVVGLCNDSASIPFVWKRHESPGFDRTPVSGAFENDMSSIVFTRRPPFVARQNS